MKIKKLTKRNFINLVFLFWLMTFWVMSFKLDSNTFEFAYKTRQYLTFLVLISLLGLFFRELSANLVPKRVGWLFVPIVLNIVALIIGSISLNVFSIVIASYMFGFINLLEIKYYQRALYGITAVSIVLAILTGDFFSTYIDGRTRLSFALNGPTTLAFLSGVLIILTGFRGWVCATMSTILIVFIYYSETRSSLLAIVILLLLNSILWDRHGNVRKAYLSGFLFSHACIFGLVMYNMSLPLDTNIEYELNKLLSGRLFIWQNAAESIGLWGGIDPNTNWLKYTQESEANALNRAPIDGFFILRWFENGLLYIPEYIFLLITIKRGAIVMSKKELQIVLFVLMTGLVESVGLGFGNLGSLTFSSLVIYYGFFHKRRAHKTNEQPVMYNPVISHR